MNKELFVLNNKDVIVTDDKGNVTKMDNSPYIIDILNVENEIEKCKKENKLIKSDIKISEKKIESLNNIAVKTFELYFLTTIGIGVLTLNIFNTALFLTPILCIFEVLFNNCKNEEKNNISSLYMKLKEMDDNEFKLKVNLGDLKAKSNMYIFEKNKNERIKEMEILDNNIKQEIIESIENPTDELVNQKKLLMHK